MPAAVRATGRTQGRLPFAAGQRLFTLLALGLLFVPVMFVAPAAVWLLAAWDVLVLALYALDLRRLPAAELLMVERSFAQNLEQLASGLMTISVENMSSLPLRCEIADTVPPAIAPLPVEHEASLPARSNTRIEVEVTPTHRGDHTFGPLYLKYEGRLRLAQRRAVFDLAQTVRVYPSLRANRQHEAMFLHSRQIQLQQRMMRLRGHGREFESLRDFQSGDERRDICWTATARRGKLVTTLRQAERSQAIWAVVDCGRLMRARHDGRSKLDYAAEAALRLAQLANFGGDTSGLLAYGQRIQQRRLPGRGNAHLHSVLDQLAQLQEEPSEADHLHAAGVLLALQKRRAMIVWITDLADLAMTPEVVSAALHASKRHRVVVAVLAEPDVARLAVTAPATPEQTYLYAAASETLRRRELTIARLRSRGVSVVEVEAPHLTGAVLNQYLEAKQKNLI